VVAAGVTAAELEMATEPMDGDMLTEFALLTTHDSVAACPG
jgi:hypothetical protein